MTRVSALGEYLRFRSALPPRLSELAILVTAAHWQQQFEWDDARADRARGRHSTIASWMRCGRAMRRWIWISLNKPLYDLCVALHRDRTVFRALSRSRRRWPWVSRQRWTPSRFAVTTRFLRWFSILGNLVRRCAGATVLSRRIGGSAKICRQSDARCLGAFR